MNMKQWLKDIIDSDTRRAMPILSFPSIQLQNITVKELIKSSDSQAKGMKLIADRCPAAASVSMMDLSVEAECFGSTVRVTDDEVPTIVGAVIETPEDAESLKVPEVGAGRTSIYIDAIKKAKELITDRPVLAGVIGPFSLAGRLMDMTELMVNCYEEPEMVHTTLEKATEFLIKYISVYKEIGADGIVIAEPAAGLVSPAQGKEFSSQYIRKITDAVQTDDFIVIYHNCGPTVSKMIPEILETNASAYHFGNAISLSDVFGQIPSDTLVMGNVDPVSVLKDGDPGKVREVVLNMMDECCKNRNYLISSGCDMPPLTPWENIDAFFAAVDEYYSGRNS